MEAVALFTWLIAAFGGFYLLGTWIARGGLRSSRSSRLPRPLVLVHFLLAGTGLVAWIAYLATDERKFAWYAFILLVPVALLGLIMFAFWMPSARSRPTESAVSWNTQHRAPTPAPKKAGREVAERHFPIEVVLVHGVFAVATVVLVLFTALQTRS